MILQKLTRNSKGFTLIELMIVIAIMGILFAIGAGAYSDYKEKNQPSAKEKMAEARENIKKQKAIKLTHPQKEQVVHTKRSSMKQL